MESLEKREECYNQKEAVSPGKSRRNRAAVPKTGGGVRAPVWAVSGRTKETLLKTVEREIKHETAQMVKELEQEAREEADKRAREILSIAIQRCAADHVAETTVSVVTLPNDEMKGRIIGREGRNIRIWRR